VRLSQCITRAAQVAPARTATSFGERSRSWAELADRVARLAAALRALGVGAGDRVAFLGGNSDRYLEWFFAVAWAGAVFVPVNTRLAPPEIEHVMNDSAAGTLFAGDELAPLARQLRDDLPHLSELVHAGEVEPPGADWHAYEHLIAASDPAAPARGSGAELAGLFYTGGTTGRAKGVMLSHDNLLSNAFHMLPGVGYGPDSVYLHAAPMFHLADGASMIALAVCGGTNAIIERFTPAGLLAAVAEQRVTHTLLVPTMIAMLVDELEREPRDVGSLRRLNYGGSPISEALIERARDALPGVALTQGYGQTESASLLTLLAPERHVLDGPLAGKTRSAGQVLPGVELAVLDEHGSERRRGEIGEICARGDNVMLGYWNQPELTRETLRGGWLHTGDAGYLDEDGYVFIVDRLTDMIVSGGENVYSVEVENAISRHPAVAECAVVGVPSERWGEQVHAVVTLRDGHDLRPAELIDHCRALIAGYKCPRSVEIRTEPLAKSGAGKILKGELRATHWAGQSRAVGW
jgi:long-chain acyl-CoA synthetase